MILSFAHDEGRRARGKLLGLGTLALVALLAGWANASIALASAGSSPVRYHGYRIVVPAGWPVYNLRSDPTVCVRFDRHAVYLGRPSAQQRCPAHAAGRTEAILVESLTAHHTSAPGGPGAALPPVTSPDTQGGRGSEAQFAISARGLIVTATWSQHPGIVRRALGVRSIGAVTAGTASAVRRPIARAGAAGAPASPGAVYTGLGFDACSAPSAARLTAWGSSPYHAAGIYIGGTNMACAQPNLSASWVSQVSAAGWHLIPTYVGRQAPTNSCGCAGVDPGRAPAEGTAAAADAIGQAQALGIGARNPIYFDMEAYPPGGTNTSAVLAFLSAWTVRLHAGGYQSGVYSSADSGIHDLVAAAGTAFSEPDDIWIADWNGAHSTSASYLPSGDWATHRRLHQYEGAHNETYGGVTINIDGDYLDGATAAAGLAVAPFPALTVSPGGDGTVHLRARWSGASNVAAWRVLGGAGPGALAALGGPTPGAQIAIAVRSAPPYFAVQALGSGGQVLAASPAVATPARIAIYGRSAFVSQGGFGGLPVGCFTGNPCHIATTISAGRTVVASTGQEFVPAGGGAVVHFRLSRAGRALLGRRSGRRLTVQVTSREASGPAATTRLNLVPFVSSGSRAHRSLNQPPTLRIIGVTHFVFGGRVGGILTGCFNAAPCQVATTIIARRTTIARSGSEFLGANELGYLIFRLTRRGNAMLSRTGGNHLGVHVIITDGTATATAHIALVRFR